MHAAVRRRPPRHHQGVELVDQQRQRLLLRPGPLRQRLAQRAVRAAALQHVRPQVLQALVARRVARPGRRFGERPCAWPAPCLPGPPARGRAATVPCFSAAYGQEPRGPTTGCATDAVRSALARNVPSRRGAASARALESRAPRARLARRRRGRRHRWRPLWRRTGQRDFLSAAPQGRRRRLPTPARRGGVGRRVAGPVRFPGAASGAAEGGWEDILDAHPDPSPLQGTALDDVDAYRRFARGPQASTSTTATPSPVGAKTPGLGHGAVHCSRDSLRLRCGLRPTIGRGVRPLVVLVRVGARRLADAERPTGHCAVQPARPPSRQFSVGSATISRDQRRSGRRFSRS